MWELTAVGRDASETDVVGTLLWGKSSSLTAPMVAERDALFSGGDSKDRRFSRKGRDLIEALQNGLLGRLGGQGAAERERDREAAEQGREGHGRMR